MQESQKQDSVCGEHVMTKHFLQKLKLIVALHQCVSMYLCTLSILDSLDVISGENVTKLQVSPPGEQRFPSRDESKNLYRVLLNFNLLSSAIYKSLLP